MRDGLGMEVEARYRQHSLAILGVDVLSLDRDEALAFAHGFTDPECQRRAAGKIAFLNAHGANLAVRDKHFAQSLAQCSVLCDGVGLDVAARLLYGKAFPFNQNGTDFLPRFFASAPRAYRVGLLGGEPEIAARAARVWQQKFPNHEFITVHHGYFDATEEVNILDRLSQDRVDVLLVAFGNPRQENWMVEKCTIAHCDLVFGVGALLDFTAGKVSRAPAWVQAARLEWAYRLVREPRRMFARYVLGNPLFLVRIMLQKLSARRVEQEKI